MDDHEEHDEQRIDVKGALGMSRRDLIRRGAVVGTLVWAVPVISSVNQKAFAESAGGGSATIYRDSNAFTCPGGAGDTSTPTGTVTISATPTQVTVSASVFGLTPNTTYDLYVNQDPGGCPTSPILNWLTTDGSGSGSAGPTTVSRVGTATVAWISLDNFPPEIHRSGTVAI
jgi:hypothetical protein